MNICHQCGEVAAIGGYASIPEKEVFDKWRCLNCLIYEVRTYNNALGVDTKRVLLLKPSDDLKQ